MTLAPLLAPQSKMAKARKTRAANATLRDFNEPNWLGGAISLACFKLSFTYKNLLDALTSTFCIVFVKVSSRQRSVQVKPHFMKSTGCEVWQGSGWRWKPDGWGLGLQQPSTILLFFRSLCEFWFPRILLARSRLHKKWDSRSAGAVSATASDFLLHTKFIVENCLPRK